ncbi:hypothetical protein FBU59_004541 [Linderina macrospora]|uniref:Uncharacterized protein n=1 Tax=Linderina macrospora TaxID=4868 RepID=A0ACC1J5G9_9FUNG|nr:hypothetical protein FBU59_004541 [Linderina macrospora]
MPSIESDGRSLTPVTPVRDERTPETADYADIDAMPEGLRVPSMHRELKEFFSGKVDPETREAVAMYFDYFYPLCPIFHPSLFIRRVVENDVDPILIDAMKATTARMVTAKTGRFVDGDALAESVKSRIISHLESPSIDYVRTLVVMTLLAGCRGEHLSYNSLIVLAASLVTRCGWHQIDLYRRPPPATWEEWVNDQIKRRIFWIVYQTDSYQSMLTGRGTTLNVSSVYVRTPCSDFEWDIVLKQGDEGQSLATHTPSVVIVLVWLVLVDDAVDEG